MKKVIIIAGLLLGVMVGGVGASTRRPSIPAKPRSSASKTMAGFEKTGPSHDTENIIREQGGRPEGSNVRSKARFYEEQGQKPFVSEQRKVGRASWASENAERSDFLSSLKDQPVAVAQPAKMRTPEQEARRKKLLDAAKKQAESQGELVKALRQSAETDESLVVGDDFVGAVESVGSGVQRAADLLKKTHEEMQARKKQDFKVVVPVPVSLPREATLETMPKSDLHRASRQAGIATHTSSKGTAKQVAFGGENVVEGGQAKAFGDLDDGGTKILAGQRDPNKSVQPKFDKIRKLELEDELDNKDTDEELKLTKTISDLERLEASKDKQELSAQYAKPVGQEIGYGVVENRLPSQAELKAQADAVTKALLTDQPLTDENKEDLVNAVKNENPKIANALENIVNKPKKSKRDKYIIAAIIGGIGVAGLMATLIALLVDRGDDEKEAEAKVNVLIETVIGQKPPPVVALPPAAIPVVDTKKPDDKKPETGPVASTPVTTETEQPAVPVVQPKEPEAVQPEPEDTEPTAVPVDDEVPVIVPEPKPKPKPAPAPAPKPKRKPRRETAAPRTELDEDIYFQKNV